MAFDKVFDFDNQESVSKVVVFREFLAEAIESHNNLKKCGIITGRSKNWKDDFISSIKSLNVINSEVAEDLRDTLQAVINELRAPTKQYNYGKDGGRAQLAAPRKSTPLISLKLLLVENGKQRNPKYKSIAHRSMKYDRFDPTVISDCVRSQNDVKGVNGIHEDDMVKATSSNDICNMSSCDPMPICNPYDDMYQAERARTLQGFSGNDFITELGSSTLTQSVNDIVVETSIYIGYPRPLTNQEIRLGRLLKVLARFVVLGSNTLKDLKNSIDCPSDCHVLHDVSDGLKDEDICKNRYPSSFFFFHDTFYIDLEPEGSRDITEGIRNWAFMRGLGKLKVADMNATRFIDLKCRLGAPYLYVHVGSCEHLVSFNDIALRDDFHPNRRYPLAFYKRKSRRIACAGCKEFTAEWIIWNHEAMPIEFRYLCGSCYYEFNFDEHGKKLFDFKASPLYGRHNEKNFAEHENSDVDEDTDANNE